MRYRTPLATTAGLGALAVTFALAGCGTEDDGPAAPALSPSSAAQTRLDIEVRPSAKGAPTTWTLTCDPAGGSHPRAEAACQALAKLKNPFAPVAKDAICTEIYGGPNVASVSGTWRGTRIDTDFSRSNGCEISRWEQLTPLLDKPA
ncbi:SSI family serine proteinase inhibitor [Thermomonospora umbrina]|uniref:Subtilisin inhibitor-like n=1 Tax=Thermomonospora umbrina TaxID=111806 RepID=A0A3D9SP44_9ACTN|nr:SSI family serine proteinase inhibitor [Thermomonospora umbrina]REE97397.1 subtilisin inhibitor-like [Thermomonospora umbrina]